VLETAESFWKLVSKMCESTCINDETIKSNNRNRMGGETLYDGVREASATGIPTLFYRVHQFVGSGPRVVGFS